jgi:hypothetical protein
MIQYKGLILNYWIKGINCSNYMENHTPTKDLKYITLEETWNKINPNVSRFHIFDSEACSHIPPEVY